jgi:hypothetical protein
MSAIDACGSALRLTEDWSFQFLGLPLKFQAVAWSLDPGVVNVFYRFHFRIDCIIKNSDSNHEKDRIEDQIVNFSLEGCMSSKQKGS